METTPPQDYCQTRMSDSASRAAKRLGAAVGTVGIPYQGVLYGAGVSPHSPGFRIPTPGGMVTELDTALTLQLVVAWAGEAGDPPRLGWWRTDMVSEYGGEDLFQRLLPNTWRWATLQAAREAARRTDAESRREAHDADALVSLFGMGVEADRRLDERLADLARAGGAPAAALPGLAEWLGQPFDRDAFGVWLRQKGDRKSVV